MAYEPNPTQALFLWNLISAMRAEGVVQTRPELSATEREQLLDAGYLDVDEETGNKSLTLTEKAWNWAETTKSVTLARSPVAAEVLEALLRRLVPFLAERKIGLAELLPLGPSRVEPSVAGSGAPAGETDDLARSKAAIDKDAAKKKALIDRQAAGKKAVIDTAAAKKKAAAEQQAAKKKAATEQQAAKKKAATEQRAAKKKAAAEQQAAKKKAAVEQQAAKKKAATKKVPSKRSSPKNTVRRGNGAGESQGALAERIEQECLSLAAGKRKTRVMLSALRERLRDVERAELDHSLLALQDARRAVLYREDNTAALTDEDRRAALLINSEPRHLVMLEGTR